MPARKDNKMMKTAKEYYSDVFEGARLSVCGVVMLLAVAVKSSVAIVKTAFKKP